MNGEFVGKSVLVTGASRGIGAQIARAMYDEGAFVTLAYMTQKDAVDDVIADCDPDRVFTIAMDVTSRSDVEKTFACVLEKWGRLDVLVNNAGYLKQTPFYEIDDTEWHKTIDTNLQGVFLCSQIGGRIFQSQKQQNDEEEAGGVIVNITSVGGQMGGTKAVHYASAKAGVISLTKSLAKEMAPNNVRVNAIAPGFIKTDMYDQIIANADVNEILASIPLGRVGLPEDVAHAAVFLASQKSSYITGHVLNVNGGLYLGAGS